MAIIQPFRAIIPRVDRIFSPSLFFGKVKHLYPIFRQAGYFAYQSTPALYIYQQDTLHNTHLGLIATTPVTAYLNGQIIPHEQTIASKETQMLKLFQERKSMIKPIMLTYPSVAAINQLLQQQIQDQTPSFSIRYKDAQHHFWQIINPTIQQQFCTLFKEKVTTTYIADGHHRTSTSTILYRNQQQSPQPNKNYDHLLCALFSTQELEIQNFNRIIKKLNGLSTTDFLEKLEKVALVQPLNNAFKPTRKHTLGMLLDHRWYALKWRPSTIKQQQLLVNQLDVSILNKVVLQDILGIADIRSNNQIQYLQASKGIYGFEAKVKHARHRSVGFTLFPITTSDFINISNARQIMPPKSTFFIPRIHNGFIIYQYENDFK